MSANQPDRSIFQTSDLCQKSLGNDKRVWDIRLEGCKKTLQNIIISCCFNVIVSEMTTPGYIGRNQRDKHYVKIINVSTCSSVVRVNMRGADSKRQVFPIAQKSRLDLRWTRISGIHQGRQMWQLDLRSVSGNHFPDSICRQYNETEI